MSDDERLARLPRWAREMIIGLREDVRTAENAARRAGLATDPAGSVAVLEPYADVPIGLGSDTSVRFYYDDAGHRWIDVEARRDGLNIRSSTALNVRPETANVIRVWPGEWSDVETLRGDPR